jgi:hypothetical protein
VEAAQTAEADGVVVVAAGARKLNFYRNCLFIKIYVCYEGDISCF